jgi:gliding motility-associated-like protein
MVLLSIWCWCTAYAQNTCSISISAHDGCIPQPVTFSLNTNNTSTATSYYWDFGDGDSSSQASPTHIYKKKGTYTPTLVVHFSDGSSCSVKTSQPIVIHGSPTPDFSLADYASIILCQRGDKYCFKNTSTPGPDKAPIRTYFWTFGNGDTSSTKNPCYAFTDSGLSVITLEVIDTNGCKNLIQKHIRIRFATDLGLNVSPGFTFTKAYDCKENAVNVFFSNTTDTAGKGVLKYYWNFDDGTPVDTCYVKDTACMKHWLEVEHTYTKTGNYFPSLSVGNKSGCIFTYRYDTGIGITADAFKPIIQISPAATGCYNQDSTLAFEAPYNAQAAYYIWDFNDPKSKNNTGSLSSTTHTYSGPGTYSVRLRVKIGSCLYDTTICDAVHLYGPIAHIMPERPVDKPWDSVPQPAGDSYIPPSQYPVFFDTTCHGPDSVVYYTYTTNFVKFGEPVYDPCLYDTDKVVTDTIVKCYKNAPPKKVVLSYKNIITGYKDTVKTTATRQVWHHGDAWPTGDVYASPPFVNDPFRIDDTTLFSCRLPAKVSFPNLSIKYRGHDAIDDYPRLIPDICHHKAYPYASDSLSYSWDFGEGTPTMSTNKNPDPYARQSSQKLPLHIYTHEGCYWVKMIALDSLTGCYDVDSTPVVTQAPDAGWAGTLNIKQMTYDKQLSLNPKNGRRGMVLYGLPCAKDTQKVSLAETLPSCYKRAYSVVFDSAASAAASCDGKTPAFYNQDQLELMGFSYFYKDTGYKTLGVVIQNNTRCVDTVWYHNYKYIHGTYPAIEISKQHICQDDSLKITALVPEQQGVKYFILKYAILGYDKYDTLQKEKTDTFPYAVHKSGSKTDTITSSVQTKGWSIYDGSFVYNSLYDSISKAFTKPGHLMITSYVYSRFGCIDSTTKEATVGFHSDFEANNNTICQEDTAQFYSDIYYYKTFASNSIGLDGKPYWTNPDSVRGGRHPLIPEKVQWDFDNDGTIDYTGIDPAFHYKKTGTYTVTMYATDSNGCVQKVTKKNFINVIGVKAHFGVAAPGPVRFCAPQFFKFIDSSIVIRGVNDSGKYQIARWIWDFGDSTPVVTITDSAKKNVTHVFLKNGIYYVKLIVTTAATSFDYGCKDTVILPVKINGPTSEFQIIGPKAGCVPFTLTVVDKSIKAKIREWVLGDGTVQSSKGEDTVFLTYKRPGVYCPSYIVADTLIDLLGNPLYCTDTFPNPHCKYKVTVYKINTQQLVVSDTLLCANKETAVFKSVPDTGYTSWTINFGDNTTKSAPKPNFTHIYREPGRYTVSIRGDGARCPDTDAIKVHVIDVKSDFGLDSTKNDTPNFTFINKSYNGRKYVWFFDDGSDSVVTNDSAAVAHEFRKPGVVKVCLTTYNEKGCMDKVCKDIDLVTSLWVPNVFTPDGDGFNDRFVVLIHGEVYYDMRVYDRWGKQVFEGHNRHDTWDGIDQKNGKPCPDGTYYYVFNYRHIGGSQKQVTGTVTLLRN